jgi:hypothetical protein
LCHKFSKHYYPITFSIQSLALLLWKHLSNFIMEIKGKLIHVLAQQTGEGKNGTWKKQDFVIETDGQYPKKVCLTIWGDKFNETFLTIGNELNVSFDAESREYNGRWFTDLKAWKIELASADSSESSAPTPFKSSAPAQPTSVAPEFAVSAEGEKDDLPF